MVTAYGEWQEPERNTTRTSDATRWAYTRRAADRDEYARVLGDGEPSYDSGQIGRIGIRSIGISHAGQRMRTGEVKDVVAPRTPWFSTEETGTGDICATAHCLGQRCRNSCQSSIR